MEINLGAIRRNWRALADGGAADVGAAVKANAYGLGMGQVARALDAEGCRNYFVATLGEAVQLSSELSYDDADASPLEDRHIYVMNGFAPDARGLSACDLRGPRIAPVIQSLSEWREWSPRWDASSEHRPPAAALQLETGMNRLGAPIEDINSIRADDLPDGASLLVMSHLASSDEPANAQNAAQRARFEAALKVLRAQFPALKASLSATGGALLDPSMHYDLIRPGVGLYGGLPNEKAEPVVSFGAPVLRVWRAETGAHVGYNGTWVAQEPTWLATVAAGYADGLPRALSNAGGARIGGVRAPIVGRVSMDLTVLDVSGLEAPPEIGEMALFLAQGSEAAADLTIDAMATQAGTIGYEILTRLGTAPRVMRHYIGR